MAHARPVPELLLLVVRPGAVLGRAASGPGHTCAIAFGFGAPLAAIAVFSSLSYVGAVTIGHTLPSFAAYGVLFFAQALAAATAARLLTGRPLRQILHTFALTYLPVELFFVFLAGVFVLTPDPLLALGWLTRSWVLPGLFLVMLLWSALLTYLAMRALAAARKHPRLRAAGATALHYAVVTGVLLAYIFGMGLLPLPVGG